MIDNPIMSDPIPLHPGWLAGDEDEPSEADYRLVWAEVERCVAETGKPLEKAMIEIMESDERKGVLIGGMFLKALNARAESGDEQAAQMIQTYLTLMRPFMRKSLCDANQERLRTIIAEHGLARVLHQVANFTTDEPVASLLQRLADIVADED